MTVEQSISVIRALLAKKPQKPLALEVRLAIWDLLDSQMTASGLAADIREYLPQLFEAYSYDMLDALKNTLSPAVWLDNGVLFNPQDIPTDGPTELLVIGDTVVTQRIPKEVTYYGDVVVKVSTGVANVMDTANLVNAAGYAVVNAHGSSRVCACEQAVISAHDYAKVKAYDNVVVHAHDFSFVDAGHNFVTLHAHDQSQFYVGLGEPRIFMDGSARGYINLESVPENPVVVHMEGDGLLYAKATRPEDLEIHSENFDGTLIRGEKTAKADALMMEIITPRFASKEIREEGISQPLPIHELLSAIAPFFNGDLGPLKMCVDERSVCLKMKTYLPALIQNGMTGDFLRRHFTRETLEDNLIHAFSRPEREYQNAPMNHIHYFFGSQLVHGDRYGMAHCYERSLLVSNNGAGMNILGGEAQGITVKWGKLDAKEQSRAVSFENSQIDAYDKAIIQQNGHSFSEVNGQVVAHLHGYSSTNAKGNAIVYLDEGAAATVNDNVRVLAEGTNRIVAYDKTEIGYPSYHPKTNVNILHFESSVKIRELKTAKEHIDYSVSLYQAKEKNLERGMRR